MKKGNQLKIEKNIEVIALDYLNISGAKDLKELEEKHQYFYEKFLEEKQRAINGKKTVSMADIKAESQKYEFANLVDKVFICKKCELTLAYIWNNKKMYHQDTPHKFLNGIMKIRCICGEENLFNLEEVENEKSNS